MLLRKMGAEKQAESKNEVCKSSNLFTQNSKTNHALLGRNQKLWQIENGKNCK